MKLNVFHILPYSIFPYKQLQHLTQVTHARAVEEMPSQGLQLEELLCGGPEVLVSFDDLPSTIMNQVA